MNLTLILWLMLFVILAVAALRRPAWGVALYMLTFFLAPPYWWWGSAVAHIRWNLFASLVMFGSLILAGAFSERDLGTRRVSNRFITLVLLIAANATLVHFLLAPSLAISSVTYILLLKMMVLFVSMLYSIRSETDLKIIIVAIVLGAAYMGYEVTFNDRGRVSGGRLEGVGTASASTSNDLACLMVTCIAFIGPLFLFGQRRDKAIAVMSGPLILNVLLLCNSRGAFLGLIILGIVYLAAAPSSIRPQVYKIAALGLLAGWLLLGDPRILERFATTFNDAEERDRSAASRVEFWQAGLMMISEHPLGAGGGGFKDVYGERYIHRVTGVGAARSVHQGYINEACEWGIQGLALRLALFASGLLLAWRTSRHAIQTNQLFISIVSLSIVAGLCGLFIQSLFGNFLNNEWGLWLIALAIGCHRLLDRGDLLVPAQEVAF
ncbi:hypothetical protein FYK55_05185 [Roseiconus nitratireducens]|uniref:O-antigen ligase-related domain-containing protein n=1 Tax=Roseiconus nitratireducens TaxID=2605748 RepID=A0A5M6DFH9_9BACT|nr:O-antigen ligase family protein [Roseiconus nitratireducens]KAA5546281.1 hypothetical protein FYK55_05185 [Roseiconus nitratireducens]